MWLARCRGPSAVTERESKDDLKVIRTKAPPPTVAELCNPYRWDIPPPRPALCFHHAFSPRTRTLVL